MSSLSGIDKLKSHFSIYVNKIQKNSPAFNISTSNRIDVKYNVPNDINKINLRSETLNVKDGNNIVNKEMLFYSTKSIVVKSTNSEYKISLTDSKDIELKASEKIQVRYLNIQQQSDIKLDEFEFWN